MVAASRVGWHSRLPSPSSGPAMNTALRLLVVSSLLGFLSPVPAQEPAQGGPSRSARQQRAGAAPSDDAFRMGSPPSLPDGLREEDMWPAATAEGWQKPCLVHWQRTFDDALAVARAENRPLMVAVNMDGEIASEHFAGVRYRQPETAALLNRYAIVMASVYRHTPRDYDEDGRRVECPRFGTVTCGEHIQAERELYERYFDGRRIAPRHIVLDHDANETMDVFYAWNTAAVFQTYAQGLEGWPEPLENPEKTLADRARSHSIADREALERAYDEGDRETRRTILRTLQSKDVVDQVEVLRTAIYGLDIELAQMAQRALAECESDGSLDLMAEALQGPLQEEERERLLAAVQRLGVNSKRARTLAALHSGLSRSSSHIDEAALAERMQEYEANAEAVAGIDQRLAEAEAQPDDPDALVDVALALCERALQTRDLSFALLLLEDARTNADKAAQLGQSGARLDAVQAVTLNAAGDWRKARARATAAVEGGLLRPAQGTTLGSIGPALHKRVLRLFADARRSAIRRSFRDGSEWPAEWLSDVNAAHEILTSGEVVDERILLEHHDFLRWIGAAPRADEVLDDALARFPSSPELHSRLRGRLLWEGGPTGLEQGYATRLQRERASEADVTELVWFAGYAALVAAEHHRRRGQLDDAIGAYERGILHYERSTELFSDTEDTCRHYVALAHAGLARVALEQGDLQRATDELVGALELRPDSAASVDGLGFSPVMTAKMLTARLDQATEAELGQRLQAALDALDPELLEPPPSELPSGGRGRGQRPQGG